MLKYYFFLIFKICVVISHTVERICCPLQYPLLTQPVKNLPAMWDTWVRSLGQSGFNLIHSHVFNFFFLIFGCTGFLLMCGLSLVGESGGYPLGLVLELLTAVASRCFGARALGCPGFSGWLLGCAAQA